MYSLYQLGWKSFQQLCLTITREVLGQTVEAYLDSADAGQDGAFVGTWVRQRSEALTGRFVIQCKFTSRPSHRLTVSDLSDEMAKIRRLVDSGSCQSYVLMTNTTITGAQATRLTAAIKRAGARRAVILGRDWIEQQIKENKRLRMLVPRVYGLGDLSQILDERAYSQARAILEGMKEDLAKVVVTDAYRRALNAIEDHRFVLLVGEPAAGKTTIASLLAMAALDQWKASPLKLSDPRAVSQHWNPDEPSQFFWLDDAFGVTQYEYDQVIHWNHVLPQIRPMLRKGARIVMTSRDYIYSRARQDLKESAFPLLKESQVVIDVHDLSLDEKRQILYNHLKLGTQPQAFRRTIKPFLERVAEHPRFVPETARRLSDPLFTQTLHVDDYHLADFVEKREEYLREVLRSLDTDSKAALALIYMRGGSVPSPVTLPESETTAIQRLGSSLGGCLRALESLKGSLVLFLQNDGDRSWQYKHPTVGDAYSSLLAESSEHLDIYLQGTAPEELVGQITCGDVGIQNAVVVPRSLFGLVFDRLLQFSQATTFKSAWLSHWGARRAIDSFLANRCSKIFLSLYLARRPETLDRVASPGLYLSAVSEVRLAQRLYELDLLPEDHRRRFVETVTEYAISGQDGDAFDDEEIRALFTRQELSTLISRARSEMIPRLDDIRREWISSRSSDEDPAEHMQPLLGLLDRLASHLKTDPRALLAINRVQKRISEWISENALESTPREPRPERAPLAPDTLEPQRSVFDDIDSTP